MSFFRLHHESQPVERIVGTHCLSRVWSGEVYRDCEHCSEGRVSVGDHEEPCEHCRGQGHVEDVRRGVSCCRSVDDLIEYFHGRGATLDGSLLVELEGELSEDDDWDARDGAVLVHPARIVSVVVLPADVRAQMEVV